jgi:hypothetical protein
MTLSKMKAYFLSGALVCLLLAGCQTSGSISYREPSKNFRVRSKEEALATWNGKTAMEVMRVWGPPDTLIKLLDSSVTVARYVNGTRNVDRVGAGAGYGHVFAGSIYTTYGGESKTRSYDSLAITDFFIDRSNTVLHARYEGDPYIYWYPSQETVTTTQSGLGYVDLESGNGPTPIKGERVSVHFTAMLTDSSIYDSSILPEFQQTEPFEFILGKGEVILGWDEGVATMRVGGKRKLIVPPHLAYGSEGSGKHIGPNATLIFYIHLLSVK